jgi:hypothetical protein
VVVVAPARASSLHPLVTHSHLKWLWLGGVQQRGGKYYASPGGTRASSACVSPFPRSRCHLNLFTSIVSLTPCQHCRTHHRPPRHHCHRHRTHDSLIGVPRGYRHNRRRFHRHHHRHDHDHAHISRMVPAASRYRPSRVLNLTRDSHIFISASTDVTGLYSMRDTQQWVIELMPISHSIYHVTGVDGMELESLKHFDKQCEVKFFGLGY